MTLSFSQWLKLGFGGLRMLSLYRQDVPVQAFAAEAEKLIAEVFPATTTEPPIDAAITHTEALRKITTGDMSAAEQAQFDRATQPGGAG